MVKKKFQHLPIIHKVSGNTVGNHCNNCKAHNIKTLTKNLDALAKSFWAQKYIIFEKSLHYN